MHETRPVKPARSLSLEALLSSWQLSTWSAPGCDRLLVLF